MANVNMAYALEVLSGASFKVIFVIREASIKKYKDDMGFDGWLSYSYNQLIMKSGVTGIDRVIQELSRFPEIIEIQQGGPNKTNQYRINRNLL